MRTRYIPRLPIPNGSREMIWRDVGASAPTKGRDGYGTTHHNHGPHVFSSEDNVVKCTGIMTLVLSNRSMLVRLRGMNLAHVDKIVEAQDDLKPLELAYVACKRSYDAQRRALVLATL